MARRIGMIGYGKIGQYLYQKLSEEAIEIEFIYDTQATKDERIASIFTTSIAEATGRIASGLDLVIETATCEAVVQLAPIVLEHSDMAVFSTTAFADEEFHRQTEQRCRAHKHNLYIPHGAVLGLDGIFDARAVLEEVSITTTKRPENLGRSDTARTILFEGPTRQACKKYSRSVNVHASIALAGLGFDKTQSRIVSDPDAPGNTHTIEIKAKGCRFRINVLSEPGSGVTGAYTPISAYSSIRRILFKDGIVIL